MEVQRTDLLTVQCTMYVPMYLILLTDLIYESIQMDTCKQDTTNHARHIILDQEFGFGQQHGSA